MTRLVNICDAKTNPSKLLADVERGEEFATADARLAAYDIPLLAVAA